MAVETHWDRWPMVVVTAHGETAHTVREAIIKMLRTALARGQNFSAVVDMSQLAPRDPARRDGLVAEQARAVRELRADLARDCRGLAFVVPSAGPADTGPGDAGDRFWGCPVTTVGEAEAATHWAYERLTAGQEGDG
ncbi:hypothetical protein [Streptomyces sp. NPDC048650]|uniref:hypothetical protein n=1 Tax=unclassified Streptomyces TaxID=2593676 RepID=UPI00372257B6